MLVFDKSNANLLKELLYRSYVHDAKLESIRYDSEDKCIKIALTNSTFGVAYDLTFKNVEIALAIKGKEYGSSETLVSLTVEKDFWCIFQNAVRLLRTLFTCCFRCFLEMNCILLRRKCLLKL